MAQAAPVFPSFDDLYAELEALPEGITGEILEPGVLRTMSRPGSQHRLVAKRIARSLDAFDRNLGGSGWWIEDEAEILLAGPKLVVPDLAGFRIARVPQRPSDNPIALVPDWCCEILSASTAQIDRALKLPLYARTGVSWVWLVDPAIRLVEVFESVAARPSLALTAKDDDVVALPPFEGELSVGAWWK